MEFVNKNLLLSLQQDLKALNKISLEILENLSSFELSSWLFPTKSYKDVSETSLLATCENNQYLTYLELMVDRLYLIINLLAKYTESNLTEEHTPRNVVRPSNLSLGASAEMLWRKFVRFEDLTKAKTSEAVISQENPLVDKDTQTKTYFPNMCNSCCTAASCIKELASELALYAEASALRKIRKDLQADIYDITQYGCMHRLTTAITGDMKSFSERLEGFKIQNKNYVEELEHVTIKYSESLKIIKNLQDSLKNVRRRFRKVKVKNESLGKRVNELVRCSQEKENRIQCERAKLKILEKSLEESTISLALLNTDNDRLQKDYTQIMSDSLGALSERDMWKSRFSETYLENRRLKSELDDLQGLKGAMDKLHNNCEELEKKLEKSNLIIEQRTELFENVIKAASDVDSNKITKPDLVVTLSDPLFVPALKSFRVKGDPVTDMKQQVEANLFSIKKLEQYNTDLQKTIHRIQERSIST